jgi:hypothetical protein
MAIVQAFCGGAAAGPALSDSGGLSSGGITDFDLGIFFRW